MKQGYDWIIFSDANDEASGHSTAYFYRYFEDCYRDVKERMRSENGQAWVIRRTSLGHGSNAPQSHVSSCILAQSKSSPLRSMQDWRDGTKED